jgi:SAM-dependent methyltransferase
VTSRFWARGLRRRRSGRLPSLGQDYQRAHREYVQNLGPAAEEWLRKKPFSVPPTFELAACLRTFAHIVERLGLGVRAQILDVGCGPGWLSEYLARCGYWVTGVDVSEDMVQIARERIERIEGPVWMDLDALAEFHALPALEIPWRDRFDAIVLYDAMHHLEDERGTLRVLHDALVPGGRVYIHEGVRPEPGSEAEQTLVAEMEEYGTLESPFDPEYLSTLLEESGFEAITRFAQIDGLFDVGDARSALADLERRVRSPETNTFLATRPIPPGLAGESGFLARITQAGEWQRLPSGRGFLLPVAVTNAGRSFWPAGGSFPYPQGTVNVGTYVERPEGRAELGRTPLPHSLPPGGSISVAVQIPGEAGAAGTEVTIDLVQEGIAWFGELGSSPLVVSLPE